MEAARSPLPTCYPCPYDFTTNNGPGPVCLYQDDADINGMITWQSDGTTVTIASTSLGGYRIKATQMDAAFAVPTMVIVGDPFPSTYPATGGHVNLAPRLFYYAVSGTCPGRCFFSAESHYLRLTEP